MYFQDGLDQPGAAGYHDDSLGVPAAYIDTGQDPQFTGSHELAEMLVDPTGNSFYAAPSPDPADNGKQVQILNEVCDPCEDKSFAINGYISWIDEQQNVWKQATNFAGQGFQVRVLAPANQPQAEGKSPR